eukprot:TRINITY_DN109013_c0_g1_i1.p1 TRINITY_DN109013_c0_g1~~TRINITY_DN109013_c0_g1_i1.p1  ORF type:complete len:193 (-),score=46.19 TRINITY_DN109013_c0_g1_i1:282-860(-)
MPPKQQVPCMACPGYVSPDRETYRLHCSTKWHQFNSKQRMMGRTCLTEDEFLAQTEGASPPSGNTASQAPELESAKEVTHADAASNAEVVTVCVVFMHKEEKWSHIFKVSKGATIMDLKKSMIKTSSPQDDAISFSLKKGLLRPSHFETLENDETFDFDYIGPEEGKSLLERDERRKRDEDEQAALRAQTSS